MAYGFPAKDRHSLPPDRRGFGSAAVHSKNTRDYGRNATTGEQPGKLHADAVNGDAPIVNHNAPFVPHVETVGWHPHTGQYVHPTHPNAERQAAGNAVHTHAPLEPKGQTYSKYGGAHGEPQSRPPSRTATPVGHETIRHHGTLNLHRQLERHHEQERRRALANDPARGKR